MWSIIWKLNDTVKNDIAIFDQKQQALEYANYYKSIFEAHSKLDHLHTRLSSHKSLTEQKKISIHYEIVKNSLKNMPT